MLTPESTLSLESYCEQCAGTVNGEISSVLPTSRLMALSASRIEHHGLPQPCYLGVRDQWPLTGEKIILSVGQGREFAQGCDTARVGWRLAALKDLPPSAKKDTLLKTFPAAKNGITLFYESMPDIWVADSYVFATRNGELLLVGIFQFSESRDHVVLCWRRCQ
jgi:hypothetical protein